MACQCACCGKTGACCIGASCTQETCAACEAAGGKFQGIGTQCFAGQCPCDPPADHTQCERCDGGGLGFFGDPLGRCQAGENCCDGRCQDQPCCCCAQITLNDLLYGDKAYSWPTIKPAGRREPDYGPFSPRPTSPATHCTDPDTVNDPARTTCCDEVSPGVFEWTCGGRWQIRPACLRWLCRCVDGNGALVCSQTFGGPTANNINLTTLALNAFGQESAAGCYVYTVEFFGWRKKHSKNGGKPADWSSRDDMYSIYKTEVTC